jgi:hypothetical protein
MGNDSSKETRKLVITEPTCMINGDLYPIATIKEDLELPIHLDIPELYKDPKLHELYINYGTMEAPDGPFLLTTHYREAYEYNIRNKSLRIKFIRPEEKCVLKIYDDNFDKMTLYDQSESFADAYFDIKCPYDVLKTIAKEVKPMFTPLE